jgi:hypothetical protein
MFKKVKPGWLMIILIILLAIYFIVRYTGDNDRNFRDKMLEIDPENITEVIITAPDQPGITHLKKEGDEWQVLVNEKAFRADTNAIQGMLVQLGKLGTKRFAGRGKDTWQKYELTDSAGTRIDLFKEGKELASLMIGKFEYTQPPQGQQPAQFRQQQGEMSTYVRRTDEKEVYVVDGFLKMTIGRNSDAYRDKNLAGISKADISKISFNYPDGRMELTKNENKWFLNNTPADSVKTEKYLGTISRLNSMDFINEDLQLGSASHTVVIEGNNFQPIEIKAYPVADTNIGHAIVSSRIPGTFFNGGKAGLFDKVMVGQNSFMSDPPSE